jgi:CheY-like chemotaxis protein
MLGEDGHRVVAVASAAEGLEALERRRCQVVICDLRMPGMDGGELYHRVSARWPELAGHFVFCTGDTANPETWSLVERAKAQLLRKPFADFELRDAVERALLGDPPDGPDGTPGGPAGRTGP